MIYIKKEKGEIAVKTTERYSLPDFVLILLNAILLSARDGLKDIPQERKAETKKAIYDMLNLRFSALLEAFAPEFELRPGLTEEAIMRAENEILEDEMSKMQK